MGLGLRGWEEKLTFLLSSPQIYLELFVGYAEEKDEISAEATPLGIHSFGEDSDLEKK